MTARILSTNQLTAEELARKLRLPLQSIWRLCREGRIPHRRIGNSLRFDPPEIEEWMRSIRKGPDAGAVALEQQSGNTKGAK